MPQVKTSTDRIRGHNNVNPPKQAGIPAGVNNEDDDQHKHEDEHGHIEPFDLVRIAITAIAASLVWLRLWEPFPHLSLIGIAGVLFGGWPIFHEAFENLRERRMTMELSMTIALFAAVGIGEFLTALIITAFVLAAEVLEGLTVGRGRRAIGDLHVRLHRCGAVGDDPGGDPDRKTRRPVGKEAVIPDRLCCSSFAGRPLYAGQRRGLLDRGSESQRCGRCHFRRTVGHHHL
jgi:hypothetical protein